MKKFFAGAAIILVSVFLLTTQYGSLSGETYQVDNWEENGYLGESMETDGEKIFIDPDTSDESTWTSEIINVEENASAEQADIEADSRDGKIEFTVNMWNDSDVDSQPDEEVTNQVETGENSFDYNISQDYRYFEYEVYIEKDNGDGLERPSVEELEVISGSDEINFTNNQTIFALLTLLLLVWGLYAVIS